MSAKLILMSDTSELLRLTTAFGKFSLLQVQRHFSKAERQTHFQYYKTKQRQTYFLNF